MADGDVTNKSSTSVDEEMEADDKDVKNTSVEDKSEPETPKKTTSPSKSPKKTASKDDEDESDVDKESDKEPDTPKRKKASPSKSPKKTPSKKEDEDESDEESDAPKKKKPTPSKSKSRSSSKEDNEDDSDEESDTPKKKKASPSKSKSKSPSKKDAEDESDNDEDDESDDEDWEELPPGLLERPYEVEGKREKKKVERLTSAPPPKEPEKFEVKEGRGVKLVDIPVVAENISQTKAVDLKPLHYALFIKHGKIATVKKNLRLFSGEPNGKKSSDHEKRMNFLKNKLVTDQLKTLCRILNLESGGGSKQVIVDRLEEFILKPVDKGGKVRGAIKRKRSKTPAGKKAKKVKTKKEKVIKKKKAKKAVEESDDEEEEAEESEDEAPKKKKVKISPTKKVKSTPVKKDQKTPSKSKTPKQNGKTNSPKKSTPKKTSPKKTPKKTKKDPELSDISDDDESSDDEPLVKLKSPSPPNNAEIKALVQKILKGADLETVTMKTVVKQVYAKYPKFDLTDRKDFIKDAVRNVIS